ncbi:tRNA pseudouridine synthase A [Rhodovastum atsumiense]|uniref:tRNA pseudouridine synthase A n=1 Tax=Rhodovastum atsumiense TaxID=504468 RepID=A0A5M6IXU0_9PROT|nr:tRNA pseudouridine(38-40) synthase TruA [Rhodovastum atsumiense]KAA5613091.1 tRNA pseudouridine(38-40) synthase TruA [Rhodovastum atsumiense]CAH2600038.1 tRNA pseudouridine synthase A [Rhodovastum atsumiense]
MPRYALLLEYDGTGFVGWQMQAQGLSLQAVLEQAASRLAGGAPVPSVVAGRTDAGVHAEGQVAQIDLPAAFPPDRLRDALNFHMKPHRLVVLRAALAPEGWNARFSAVGRGYRYRILNRRPRPGLLEGRVWHVERDLDVPAMAAAARLLLGRHDFSSFRAAACQARSPLRTLDRLEVTRQGELVEIVAEARSFLHHQVRNMTGTLKLVGEGRWPVGRVAEALAARDRRAAGPTAPPEGLALTRVRYDPDPFTTTVVDIPEREPVCGS